MCRPGTEPWRYPLIRDSLVIPNGAFQPLRLFKKLRVKHVRMGKEEASWIGKELRVA